MMLYCLHCFLIATEVLAETQAKNIFSHKYYTQGSFEIVARLSTFVDKTLFIKYVYPKTALELGSVTAYLAPRRFGKTVNLDMLRRFFGAECDEFDNQLPQHKNKYYQIFSKLKIGTEEEDFFKEHFAQYPVLWIDFSNYHIRSDYESALQELTLMMYKDHAYLEKSDRLRPGDRQEFIDTFSRLRRREKFTYSEGLSLLKWLKIHYKRPVIMLFDEADAPALKTILSSKQFGRTEDDALTKLFEYLRPMVKNNDNVLFSVLTGTTRIGDVASHEINVFQYESVFDSAKIASFYGFSEEDMMSTAKLMGRLDMVEQMKKWFNGYAVLGSNKTINNTLSVTASFTTGIVKSFWDAGHGLDSLSELFGYHVLGQAVEESLFAPLKIHMKEKISKDNLLEFKKMVNGQKQYNVIPTTSKDLFFQYLFDQGYYTFDEMIEKTGLERIVRIKVPNKETRCALSGKLYTPGFFQEKYKVGFDANHNYVMSLKYLNASVESVERLKQSIAGIFKNRPPRKEAEFRADLYHIANSYGDNDFLIVGAEKFVKKTKEELKEIDRRKLERKEQTRKRRTKITAGKKKKREKDGGVSIDILVVENRDASTDKHSENAGETVKILECKCTKQERACDAMYQILDNEYYTVDYTELYPGKKEVDEKPRTMQYIGVSYTEEYSFEVCVMINTTDLKKMICR